jgi:membrane protease subunit HflC
MVIGGAFYIVDEREQVVVTRFNKPVRVIVGDRHEDFETLKQQIIQSATRSEGSEGNIDVKGLQVSQGAGLYFKMPFIDFAEKFPDTLLEYDVDPEDIVTADKKKLIVDNFARWRIENPLLFRIRVRTELAARGQLDDVIYSIMREELGRNNLIEVIRTTKKFEDFAENTGADGEELEFAQDDQLTNTMLEVLQRGRAEIMATVTRRADAIARERYGIRIIDVRIKRAELLPENLDAVFRRMQAERDRISKGYRSEGEKAAQIIRGETDKRVAVILANAQREAQETRGEGDAQSIKIFAEAFGSNAELYSFMRGLEVMKEATPMGTEMIVGLNSSIYKLLTLDDIGLR